MKGLFVTGTDTDIGKTALSALLLAELRKRGTHAGPMKPAQTGCVKKGFRPEALDLGLDEQPHSPRPKVQSLPPVPDLDYSLSMAAMEVDSETYANMAPYTFEPACSPHLAAERAGTEIDIAEIIISARTLSKSYDFIIAEGAGGIVVPLNRRETMLDLMHALKLPVIIAARPGLGTINHTLLSIRTLRSDGLDIAGVVFVTTQPDEPSFIEEDNAATIEQFGKVPVLGTIPHCTALQSPNPNYNNLPRPITEEVQKIVSQLAI